MTLYWRRVIVTGRVRPWFQGAEACVNLSAIRGSAALQSYDVSCGSPRETVVPAYAPKRCASLSLRRGAALFWGMELLVEGSF
jgi:hypothetical protein